MGRRSALRNRLEALAASAAGGFVRGTAEEAEAFGRRLGLLYRRLGAGRRRLAESNVAAAYPEKSAEEGASLVRDVFAHFGGVAGELLHAAGRPTAETLARIEIENAELAKRAFATRRGVFYLTAHLGNWEWAALATGSLGIPLAVIVRPLDNELLDERLSAFRSSTGNRVVAKRDASREMLRTLRGGGGIGILMDQHARPPDGIPSTFFGRTASTSSSLARILDRTEALVVPTTALRTGPARWRLTYHDPLDVRALAPDERETPALTQRINGILEGLIRRTPEQWLWLHNRWRSG